MGWRGMSRHGTEVNPGVKAKAAHTYIEPVVCRACSHFLAMTLVGEYDHYLLLQRLGPELRQPCSQFLDLPCSLPSCISKWN